LADLEPEFDQLDIDNANGPVDTVVDGSNTRLMVDTQQGKPIDVPGVPCFSTKYRVDFDESDLTLTTTTYVTRFTYSGSGKFIGLIVGFSSTNTKIRLTIDSEEFFDMTSSNIQDVQSSNPGNSGPSSETGVGGPQFDITDKKVVFYPPFPVEYKTNILIEVARENVGGPDPVVQRSMVVLTKET
jgi:hypothetical protein